MTAAELLSELETDPTARGYATLLAAGNDAAVAALLNAQTFTQFYAVPWATVAKWGASEGLRSKIQVASNDPTNTARDFALLLLDFVGALGLKSAASEGTMDITDPAIVGAAAGGAAYIPGAGSLIAGGMLDALIAAKAGDPSVAAPIMTQAQKDALINLGKVPASRAEVLWGYGATVDHGQISAAWLPNRPGGIVGGSR